MRKDVCKIWDINYVIIDCNNIWIIILIFGIYVVRNLDDRISNETLIDNNRLNSTQKNNEDNLSQLYVYDKVPPFEFINQNGETINNDTYLGKVYVVEFFFTTCPTICPMMNDQMLLIQEAFAKNLNFGIASISITPKIDTQEVLKDYAINNGITHKNWHLLSGKSEEEVFNFFLKLYLLSTQLPSSKIFTIKSIYSRLSIFSGFHFYESEAF